ncbi:MAG: type III toxin-antitoxin system ToxN/AbiQ family toxin [Clostridiales Family XIII bacterium]|jgi:hypothetical protein|nr:type III toxin-antitoxin system ToxN/AbiQ family toxin [Clostridiales Family XIII bacterium]
MKLNFYNVDKEYINYPKKFDKKVPNIDYSKKGGSDKFICGILFAMNTVNYFAVLKNLFKYIYLMFSSCFTEDTCFTWKLTGSGSGVELSTGWYRRTYGFIY